MSRMTNFIFYFFVFFIIKSKKQSKLLKIFYKCIRNTFKNQTLSSNKITTTKDKTDLDKYLNSPFLQLAYMVHSCRKVKESFFESIYGQQTQTLGTGSFGNVAKYCQSTPSGDCVAVKQFNSFDMNTTLFLAFKELNNSICLRTFIPAKVLENFAVVRDCFYIFHNDGGGSFRFVMDFYPHTLEDSFGARFDDLSLQDQVDRVYQMLEITLSLKSMHRYGIAHTDLKPQNILLDSESRVRLADFGTTTADFAADHELMGSPLFLDPELVNKDAWASAQRGDLFALGVLFSAMFQGQDYRDSLTRIIKEGGFFKKIKDPESESVYQPDLSEYYFPEEFGWMRTILQSGIKRMSLKKVVSRLNQYLHKRRFQFPVRNEQESRLKLSSQNMSNQKMYIARMNYSRFWQNKEFREHPLNATTKKKKWKKDRPKQRRMDKEQLKQMLLKRRRRQNQAQLVADQQLSDASQMRILI